jgi:hypothetical protein
MLVQGQRWSLPSSRGLPTPFDVNSVFFVIIEDVAVLTRLVVIVFVALSKGLVIAIMLP